VGIEPTPSVVAVLGTAAFLIGLSKGGLGGGLGPFITVLVAVVTGPSQAIGVLLPVLMTADVAAVWVHRRDWDRNLVRRLLPGAVIGIAATSLLLGNVDDRVVEWGLIVLSVAFAAYRLIEPRLRRMQLRVGPGLALVAGAASGFTSTIAHSGTPPIAVYLLAARTPPVTYVATTAVFFFVVNWLKVPGYLAAGLLDASVLRLAPLALLLVPGVLVGRWLVDRVEQQVFERIVIGLLLFGAVYLLVS
jgi:uncharacterized membrane protein YfcA